MKRFQKIAIGLGLGLAVLLISAGVAAATEDQVVSGTTDHAIYKVGRTITITGTVNGDIFCVGQTVNIDATVNGDVLCAGQTVTVEGTVNGNVRVTGQTVNIGAKVDRSATMVAQDATLQSNASVGSDVSLGAQTANIDGPVGRDLHGDVHTLILSSAVNRDIETTVDKLELNNGASVGHNLTYTSPHQLSKSSGASIGGKTSYHSRLSGRHNRGGWQGFWLGMHLYLLAAGLIFAMVLVALFPQLFIGFNKLAAAKPWMTLLSGFIAMFIVPVIILALGLTLVGLPLALFVGLTWLLVLALSAPLSAFYIGRLILAKEKRIPVVLLVGSLVLWLISLIPFLGFIVIVLAIWFGSGNLLLNLHQAYKKPVYKT